MRPPAENPDSPQDETQRDFDRQAEELDLELENPSRASREIGLIFLAARRVAEVTQDRPVRPVGDKDDEAIEELLETWASLEPEQRQKEWGNYTTDPAVGVGWGQVGLFTQKSYDRWVDSPARERLAPLGSGGDVSIEDLQITYAGDRTAVASYRIEYPDAATNAGAMLLKTDDGWRVAAELIPGTEPDTPKKGA